MFGIQIKGTGSYLPSRTLTNDDLSRMVETSDEWIVRMTGIKTRHIASEQEATSDLCFRAAEMALKKSHLQPEDIDMIILGTSTPDMLFPATACLVQQKLGCRAGIPAFDFEIACSSYVYGLIIASQFIKTGLAKNILFVTGDVMSRYMDYTDRSTCILFGDGASACVLSASETDSLLGMDWGTDGYIPDDLLSIRGGGSRVYTNKPTQNAVVMDGPEIYRRAVRKMSESTLIALKNASLRAEAIDHVIPHQANIRIMHAVMKYLGMPLEKLISTVEDHANTSGATIGIALDKAIDSGIIKRGEILGLTAFGAGLSWGSVIIKY